MNYTELTQIIREEFADIVIDIYRLEAKLRVLLCDESYLDFWWSEVQEGRFAHHWNRQNVNGTIYRHDNSPHQRWAHISTFPQHCHHGQEKTVTESYLPQEPQEAVRRFLEFCRDMIQAGTARQ